MFTESFLMVFGCIFLSLGFVLWATDDYVESQLIGAQYAKKMAFVGVVSLIISIAIHNFK